MSPRVPSDRHIGAESEPLTADEQAVLSEAKRVLGDDLNGLPRDAVVQFIRGYVSEPDWMATSVSHMKTVSEWRKEEQCDTILEEANVPPKREQFESMWRTGVIGEDPEGHPVIIESIGRIPAHEFKTTFDEKEFLRHCVYNKEVLRRLCIHHSHRLQRRLYKFVVVLDMDGLSLTHLSRPFIHLVKTYISAFSNFYPESLHKLYMINVPRIFAATWALIKPMLHPLTAAKINIFAAMRYAEEAMANDGLRLSVSLKDAYAHAHGCLAVAHELDLIKTGAVPYLPAEEATHHQQTAAPAAGSAAPSADAKGADAADAEWDGPALTGTLELEGRSKPVVFSLSGRTLRYYATEKQMHGSEQPLGELRLQRVHGGASHLLLYGQGGRALTCRRGPGSAIVELAAAKLAGRADKTIGAGSWVDLSGAKSRGGASRSKVSPERASPPAPAPAAKRSAEGAPRATFEPPAAPHRAAPMPTPPPSVGFPTTTIVAIALALCAANLAILGRWRLELTWE